MNLKKNLVIKPGAQNWAEGEVSSGVQDEPVADHSLGELQHAPAQDVAA